MKTILSLLTIYLYLLYLIALIISSIYAMVAMYNILKGHLLLPDEHKLFTYASCYILFSVALESYIKLHAMIQAILSYI